MISYESEMTPEQYCNNVRYNIGVDEVYVSNQDILSPTNDVMFKNFLKKQTADLPDQEITADSLIELIDAAKVCYTSSRIARTMNTRLPIRMENLSTKTLLAETDWDALADKMEASASELLADLVDELATEETIVGSTIVDLTGSNEYTNGLV